MYRRIKRFLAWGYITWFILCLQQRQLGGVGNSSDELSTREIQTDDDNKGFLNVDKYISRSVRASAPEIIDLMKSYIDQHAERVVRQDPNFCDRQFVVAVYGCPRAMGNHMMEYLSAFVVAAVTNRTLVWQFCNRRFCDWDNEYDCEQGLHRFHWIMSFETAKKSWSRKGCSSDLFDGTNWHVLYDARLRGNAEEIVSCCPLEELPPHPFLNVGINNFMEMYSITSPKSLLRPESRRRADILSSKGALFLFGILFRISFRFQAVIIQDNDRLIASKLEQHRQSLDVADAGDQESGYNASFHQSQVDNNRVVMVGIHLRHADPYDKGLLSLYNEVPCLKVTIARAERNFGVPVQAILFASDREHQVRHWAEARHFPRQIFISSNHTAHHQPEAGYFSEHGTRTGVAAVKDLELLSRSHYFIGSRYFNSYAYMRAYCSTFSMLIACLQATNGFQAAQQHMRSVFLDKCDGLTYNRDEWPPILDMSSQANCSKESIRQRSILMPNDCPNFVDV